MAKNNHDNRKLLAAAAAAAMETEVLIKIATAALMDRYRWSTEVFQTDWHTHNMDYKKATAASIIEMLLKDGIESSEVQRALKDFQEIGDS